MFFRCVPDSSQGFMLLKKYNAHHSDKQGYSIHPHANLLSH